MLAKTPEQINDDLLRPVFHTSRRFFMAVAVLGAIVLAAFGAWGYQMYAGIGV